MFDTKKNPIQCCFWTLVFALNVALSLYWSVAMYSDWQQNAVITKIVTSALDIKEIDFPSVTFCSNGLNEGALKVTLLKAFSHKILMYNFQLCKYSNLVFKLGSKQFYS